MRPVNGFEGRYSITYDGKVFSHITGKTLKPRPLKNGYLRVCLVPESGEKVDFLIHRLVCEAYHGAPSSCHVNHKDCDKTNNHPNNLEWCDRFHNMQHASENGLLYRQSERLKILNQQRCSVCVEAVSIDGTDKKHYASMSDAKVDGFSHSKISLCLSGKRRTHKGYIWSRGVRCE